MNTILFYEYQYLYHCHLFLTNQRPEFHCDIWGISHLSQHGSIWFARIHMWHKLVNTLVFVHMKFVWVLQRIKFHINKKRVLSNLCHVCIHASHIEPFHDKYDMCFIRAKSWLMIGKKRTSNKFYTTVVHFWPIRGQDQPW